MRERDLVFRAFVSLIKVLSNRWDLPVAELHVILRLDERDAAHSAPQMEGWTDPFDA